MAVATSGDAPSDGAAVDFYRRTLQTKDLDLFVVAADVPRIGALLADAGYRAELTFPHWLGKIHCGPHFVDLVFSSANGVARVDDEWFEHATRGEALGMPVWLCPVEETIWSKAFIMERERYDGADIAHLLHARARTLDWRRLYRRFGAHWRVLFVHLLLFGYVYPAERDLVPAWLMDELALRLREELRTAAPRERVCGGTLISREQYLVDVTEWGFEDARLAPRGTLSPDEVHVWTRAIRDERPH